MQVRQLLGGVADKNRVPGWYLGVHGCSHFGRGLALLAFIYLLFLTIHCKYIHCKKYRFYMCPNSHCTFNVLFTLIECMQ